MINLLIDFLVETYLKYLKYKESKKYVKEIIPKYVLKRRIQIYNNDKKVFDSNDVDEIPNDIKYVIKYYGIPENIKPNNKTPLVYHINTTLSPLFDNKDNELECMNSITKKAV